MELRAASQLWDSRFLLPWEITLLEGKSLGGSNPIFPDPDFGKTWQGRMQAAGGVIGVSYLYAT